MRNAIPSCRQVFWAAPLVLLSLLAGCVGRNAQLFPWSEAQESRLEHVSAATFDERVLRCEKTVLVDFYAEWCGPCKKLGPVLEGFAQEHPDIRVLKVDVDENPDLAGRYGVKNIPCLLVFHGGQVTSRSEGWRTKQELNAMSELGVR